MAVIPLYAASAKPLYLQLYSHYRADIEQRRLTAGEKLPSIRSLAKSLGISKITVEKAYQQLLSEGYIESGNRSRHIVCQMEDTAAFRPEPPRLARPETSDAARLGTVDYDFSSGEMDREGFDFALWKRYVNKAFRYQDRLTGYGTPQGEGELRREIARYIRASRGVEACAGQIIVAPGVQSLLNILCSLLKSSQNRIAFEEPGFKNGRRIFADHDFAILPVAMSRDGIDMIQLGRTEAKLLYISPSHQFPTGHIMPIGKRLQLLSWAERNDALLIEDDYDSEFRYIGRPIPALKGLDKNGQVIYLGSFSKIIPPAIRISFMVVPDRLMPKYEENISLYNQTASTLEQMALALFMADGHLDRQVRRLRKRYHEKSLLFYQALQSIMGDRIIVNPSDSGLYTSLTVKTDVTEQELVKRALARRCAVAAMSDYYWDKGETQSEFPRVILYFSKIPANELGKAIGLLRDAWFS